MLSARWTSFREEGEAGEEPEPERLVVEAVAHVPLEAPRQVLAPGQIDAEARAHEELAVVVATTRRAGDADEWPHVHHRHRRGRGHVRGGREVIERAELQVVDEHAVGALDFGPGEEGRGLDRPT